MYNRAHKTIHNMNNNVTSELSKNYLGTGDIRLRIETTMAKQLFLLFYEITTEEGGFVTVDWGDGNKETFTGKTTYTPKHVYAKAGEYIVKLTGSKFTEVGGGYASGFFRAAMREILSLKMPADSKDVSLFWAFYGCDNLTGNIPAWDDCITNANSTYEGCTGLTGRIPEWGANITKARYTYKSCKGLTGDIPAWGVKIVDTKYTYFGCSGLTGCSKELLQDPMPSRITRHTDCVRGCVDEIRKHFTIDWGGTKTS